MTVVARLNINDFPTLVGDLLLSIEDPSASPSAVPTAGDLSALFPAGSPCIPCGLRQKLAVVADNLVVGWSGALDVARDVVGELRRRSVSQPFTFTALTQELDGFPTSVWDEIGLVGFLDEPNNRVCQWGRNSYA